MSNVINNEKPLTLFKIYKYIIYTKCVHICLDFLLLGKEGSSIFSALIYEYCLNIFS